MFSNQVAEFVTELDEECVVDELKAIEREAGRRPGDKVKEKICLDIDLLMYDGKTKGYEARICPERIKRVRLLRFKII